MKRILFLLIIVSAIVYYFSTNSVAYKPLTTVKLDSENVVVLNKSGKIIMEKEAQMRVAPASLTKLMTAIIVVETIHQFQTKITIEGQVIDHLQRQQAKQAGFQPGEQVTVTDLMYGLLLPSGAEAAITLANHVSGSEEEFVQLMNDQVEKMNLTNTHFKNSTGLDAEGQYTTASDLAIILNYAWKNNTIRTIMSTPQYTTSTQLLTMYSTAFQQLQTPVKGYLGGKTGTTKAAGYCLASVYKKGDELFYIITMNGLEFQPYQDLISIKSSIK
ncbi:D-alanyl-D-alanine carboxypeptidase family protein [Kurthia sibirica]|uniref:D-alanyl-D-alanine carboxypeptidase n=1 Tax=Kurthia sibirica TaxID=202750 RepID=A0A2U3AG79_9BACL|nr:D-alanyl-D-alanine carboxypeptidase [Kurthia sibirica]PWI23553.1 D-alanyl-D-alanine carboxypeptidase [Kurthia sibirica]GEK35407.1 hypothetical protein KSI01_29400 [Kurthia sibirica]